jgi:Glycosyl transferase family 11
MDIQNKPPLVITINGGLGNQLFMLFAGISKAIDEKRGFVIHPHINKRNYYFEDFYPWLSKYLLIDHYKNLNIQKCYEEKLYEYVPIPDNYDLIQGYFQTEKYFVHNYETLRKMFKINEYQNESNYRFNDTNNNICIHFRLGDFLHPNHFSFNRILKMDYYINSLNYLKEKLGDKYFYTYNFLVFGEKENDDMITENLKVINSNFENKLNFIKIYDYNSNLKDYEELILMSNCNHFIIANSTFSWWGAYLSTYKNRIILCPHISKFFSDETLKTKNLKDLYPNNFIQIDY